MSATIENTSSNDVPPEYISVPQAAELADVHEATVRRWVKEGHLPRTLRLPNLHLIIHLKDLTAHTGVDAYDASRVLAETQGGLTHMCGVSAFDSETATRVVTLLKGGVR